MKSLLIVILALATLTFAASDLPRALKLPKNHPQLYTNLDAYIPGLPGSNAYLQDLLTFSVNYAVGEGIKEEKLSRQAKWTLGKVLAIGHLQGSQSQFFFNFELVTVGNAPVVVVVGVSDHPSDGSEDVVFFAIFENALRGGTVPALQWPISFPLSQVQDSKYTRSLIRYGIEYVLEQAQKSGIVGSKDYEIAYVVSVAIDVVDDATFYFIDVTLTLPDLGFSDISFVIKDDPNSKKDLAIVASSLDVFEVLINEL